MLTAMESGNLKAWKKAYVTTVARVSAPAIFMNLEIILGRSTHPCSSLRSMGREFSVKAEQDLTRMSNSPAGKHNMEGGFLLTALSILLNELRSKVTDNQSGADLRFHRSGIFAE